MRLKIFLFFVVTMVMGVSAQKRVDGAAWVLLGDVVNSVTRHNVLDTINVTLLTEDSVSVKTVKASPQLDGSTRFYMEVSERNPGAYRLLLSHPDYADAIFPIMLEKKKRRLLLGSLPIRRLTRAEKITNLDEVSVVATKVKFFHKGDTLVFNADAFNLAQGSMLDALIEQLPGVELDANGVIKVNGKPVESLLLNGKDFFKGKSGVMLENMPAYMVKHVKVYDRKDEDGIGMRRPGSEKLTMDVSLKKEFSKGVIANAEIGEGTENRYTARGFGLLFSDRSRFSAYAKINNTNETRTPGRDGNWSDGRSNSGRQIIREGGFDYGVFGARNRYQADGSVVASLNDNDLMKDTRIQNFLPEGDNFVSRFSGLDSRNLHLHTLHNFKIKNDSSLFRRFVFGVYGQYIRKKVSESIIEATFSQNPASASVRDSLIAGGLLANSAVNRLLRAIHTKGHDLFGKVNADTQILFKGSDDFMGVSASAESNSSRAESPEDYRLYYGRDPATLMDRLNRVKTGSAAINAEIYYAWRPDNRWQIVPQFFAEYRRGNNLNDWFLSDGKVLTLSEAEDILWQLDHSNSYNAGNTTFDKRGAVGVFYDFQEMKGDQSNRFMQLWAFASVNMRHSSLNYHGEKDFRIVRNFTLPNFDGVFSFSSNERFHYFDVKYSLTTTAPLMMNLLDVTFTSDPLNIRCGNPELKNSTRHKFQANYRADGLYKKGMFITAQLEYGVSRNAQAIHTFYDRSSGVRTTTPVNINGNWDTHARSDMSFPLTRSKNLTLGATVYCAYNEYADMTLESGMSEAVRTIVSNTTTWDILSLEYRFGKSRVKAKGELNYNYLTGSRAGFASMNVWRYEYGVTGLFTLPMDFQISTDIFMHSKRGFADPAANENSFVWNASLIKPLFKGRVTLKLDAFDILHQVRNTSVSINSQGRTETSVNTLPSYFMLRVAYSFSRSPKK